MITSSLLNQIDNMLIDDKLILVNCAIQSIKKDLSSKSDLPFAVREMESEYKINKDLTAFTDLDAEEFYEAR